jgi:Domain of unknown function (DUF4926)
MVRDIVWTGCWIHRMGAGRGFEPCGFLPSGRDRNCISDLGVTMIKEHDRVVLKKSVPEQGLKAGDVGTVVHVHRKGEAFEVEFLTLNGETVAVATLTASQVRPVLKREITHARLIRA